MEKMKEKAKKIVGNTPQFNFKVERNNAMIGKMQGIPIENRNYIHVIVSTVNIEKGDFLINNLNQKFAVNKTEIIENEILRIYFAV